METARTMTTTTTTTVPTTTTTDATCTDAPRTGAMLTSPEVVRAITVTLLRFGVARQELADGVAEVQMQTLDYLKARPHPEQVPEWKALCATIAKNWQLKEKKKDETRAKYDAGLCEEPDAYAPLPAGPGRRERVDAGRLVQVLEAMFEAGEMPERGDEILDCVQARMTSSKTAAEVGLNAQTVRNRLLRMRRLYTKRLARLGLSAVILLLLLLAGEPAWLALHEPPAASVVTVPPVATVATVRKPPPGPSPEAVAASLREVARRECGAYRWLECRAKLDEARALDPRGDGTSEVLEMRSRIEDGLDDTQIFRAKSP